MSQEFRSSPGAVPRDVDQGSAAGLLRTLVNDVSALFRNEVALAKAELADAANSAKQGLIGIAAAGAVMFGGVMALLAAIILALSKTMEPWLAALIVAVVLIVVGFVMLQAAKKKLEPSQFKLERTQHSLQKDSQTVARSTP